MTTTSVTAQPARTDRAALVRWAGAMALSGTIGATVVESGAGAPIVAFARCLVGGLLLAVWCAARGWLRADQLRMTRRDLALAVLGGVLLVGNWVLLFASYALSSISVATVIYHTQPLMLVGLAVVLLGEKLVPSQAVRAGIAFGGVALISLGAHGTDGKPVRLAGIALALGAAALYAGASLIAKRLSHIRPHVLAAIQCGTGVVLLAPALAFAPLPAFGAGWLWLGLLGSLHTAVLYVLMYSSIGRLPTGLVAVLSYLYPVVALLVDVLAYQHQVRPAEAAGMIAVLGAALAPASLTRRSGPRGTRTPGHRSR